MFKYEGKGKCERCGTQFEYPKNIFSLIERYLAQKDYSYVNHDNTLFIRHPHGKNGGVCLSLNTSFFTKNLQESIRFIADYEKRTPQKVLFDVTYDQAKYLQEQLSRWECSLEGTTEDDWINKIQCEQQVKRYERELEEELQKQKELDIKVKSHRRTMK